MLRLLADGGLTTSCLRSGFCWIDFRYLGCASTFITPATWACDGVNLFLSHNRLLSCSLVYVSKFATIRSVPRNYEKLVLLEYTRCRECILLIVGRSPPAALYTPKDFRNLVFVLIRSTSLLYHILQPMTVSFTYFPCNFYIAVVV